MKRKWTNVPGTVVVEVYAEGGAYFDASMQKIIPAELRQAIASRFPLQNNEDRDWWEVDIRFTSSGYYQSARISGPPEDCEPAEGDDERLLESVRISPCGGLGYNEGLSVLLPADEADVIFELYRQQVEDYVLEPVGDEPPEDRDWD